MNKVIFGFVGQIASGKGTATEYLKTKHGASTYRFSTMLRDVLDRLYINQTRENLQAISQILRENFGEETLAHVMAEDVKNDKDKLVIIDGIRRPDDVKNFKKIPGFILVNITADIEKRFERIKKRSENLDDKQKTLEEFKADHKKEAELKINEIATEAKEIIDNNGNLENLYQNLDKLLAKYTN